MIHFYFLGDGGTHKAQNVLLSCRTTVGGRDEVELVVG